MRKSAVLPRAARARGITRSVVAAYCALFLLTAAGCWNTQNRGPIDTNDPEEPSPRPPVQTMHDAAAPIFA